MAIAGVQGNGQTELVEAIVGLRTIDSGTITISGENVNKASPRHVADLGVAHIPEDRMRDGLIAGMTVEENYILNSYHRAPYSSGGRLDAKAIATKAAQGVQDFDIRTPSIDTMAELAVGRQPAEGRRRARVLPAAQARRRLAADAWPGRRLDRVHPRPDRGAARRRRSGRRHRRVPELDEVLAVGDRIAVMFGGRIVGILEGAEATREAVGMLMGGGRVKRLRRIVGPAVVPILAVLSAFLVGSVFMFITDIENLKTFPTDPVGTIVAGDRSTSAMPTTTMIIGAFGDPIKIIAAIGSE